MELFGIHLIGLNHETLNKLWMTLAAIAVGFVVRWRARQRREYDHDALGRITEERYVKRDGSLIERKTFSYSCGATE